MTISDNLTEFYGLNVEIYSREKGLRDPENTAYKLSVDYEEADEGMTILDKFNQFIDDPKAGNVKALIIGSWEEAFDGAPENLILKMIENVQKLQNLRALFIGEMTYEECEMSWIIQRDYSDLLNAFTQLELLQIRGASELSFEDAKNDNLKSLIVETGGLPNEVIDEIMSCRLPELTHLELWLGDENYGFDGDVEIVQKLVENNPFPKLTYLGLRNSEIADDIAEYLADHPILSQLDVLDLSLGNLSDEGARALLAGSTVRSLKKLDLHHHYISDDLLPKFEVLGISVDLSDQQEADEYDGEVERYIYVSE